MVTLSKMRSEHRVCIPPVSPGASSPSPLHTQAVAAWWQDWLFLMLCCCHQHTTYNSAIWMRGYFNFKFSKIKLTIQFFSFTSHVASVHSHHRLTATPWDRTAQASDIFIVYGMELAGLHGCTGLAPCSLLQGNLGVLVIPIILVVWLLYI